MSSYPGCIRLGVMWVHWSEGFFCRSGCYFPNIWHRIPVTYFLCYKALVFLLEAFVGRGTVQNYRRCPAGDVCPTLYSRSQPGNCGVPGAQETETAFVGGRARGRKN